MKDDSSDRLQVHVRMRQGESYSETLARHVMQPENATSVVLAELARSDLGTIFELEPLVERLARIAETPRSKRSRRMLAMQAEVLDHLFNSLAAIAARSLANCDLEGIEIPLKLGLRAQLQCVRTIEALDVLAARPAVVEDIEDLEAENIVMVDTNCPPAAARASAANLIKKSQNELSRREASNGRESLDRRGASASGREDSCLATVGLLNRAAHAERES